MHTPSRVPHVGLWILQVLLALLFLYAGAIKFVIPAAELARNSSLSPGFLRFIGACEVLGALGLVLPGLFRIRTVLTPLAAAGLVVIMGGAVVVSAASYGAAAAAIPLVVGVLTAVVALGRRPRRGASRQPSDLRAGIPHPAGR